MFSRANISFLHSVQTCLRAPPVGALSRKIINIYGEQTNLNIISRNFNVTRSLRLRTLFPEDDQKKIINSVNEILQREQKPKGIPIPKRVFTSFSEIGPLEDINDLLEKYDLSSKNAVKLCYAILESADQPDIESEKKLVKKRGIRLDRKLKSLKNSISPVIEDPSAITKFTALTVSDQVVSFVVLECQGSNWKSQNLVDWNVIDVTNLPLFACVTKIWNSLPNDDVFLAYNIPSREQVVIQCRLYGAVMCILCAKNSFEDVNQKVFEMRGTAPPRHFNLVVGNEIVSPLSMLSSVVEGKEESTPDDHVFRRSVREINFSANARVKFHEFDDVMKESISQSLIVGKAFVELLKVCHEKEN